MRVSISHFLTAGVSLVAAGALAITPFVPAPIAEPAHVTVQTAARIELAASVRTPVVVPPQNRRQFATAVAAIERLEPSLAKASVRAATPAAATVPLNAASDLIISGYQFIQYWVDYGVQLTNYVLRFIPYGYLIADQVNIFYYNLVRPISDSVVYGLIVPVVNDPLNPASYVNGVISVGQTSVKAAINTGIAEFNYFFGWLIPPLPPLPLAAKLVEPAAAVSVTAQNVAPLAADVGPAASESEPTTLPTPSAIEAPAATAVVDSVETHGVTIGTVETAAQAPLAEAVTSPPDDTTTDTKIDGQTSGTGTTTPTTVADPAATTTSAGGVQAQGEIRDGTQTTHITQITNPATQPRQPGVGATKAGVKTDGADSGTATVPRTSDLAASTDAPAKADDGPVKTAAVKTDANKDGTKTGTGT